MNDERLRAAADVFRHGAAGKSGWRVWTALGTEPATAKALSATLLMHVATVRRLLHKLCAYGLARELDPGLWCRGEADPVNVVPGGRQAGAGERQRVQHQRERKQYRELLAYRRRQGTRP